MKNQRIHRNEETKHHPSGSFLPSHFLRKSTVGGIGGMLLPLSLEIVTTDISLGANAGALWGALWGLGVVGRKNKERELSRVWR